MTGKEIHEYRVRSGRRERESVNYGPSNADNLIEQLLDAAFAQLAWDSDERDFGTILQRKSLKARFSKILSAKTK